MPIPDGQDDRSRVTGDCYARGPGVRFPGLPDLKLLQVAEDFVGGANAFRCSAFHESLEVDRAVLAGEVDVPLPHFFVAAEAGVLARFPV